MPDEQQLFSRFEELYWQVSRNMGYIWKKIFEERFPGSQAYIIFLLEKNGQQKMSELADSLRLTPGAVTTASDKLIENDYIARVRDEKDRRVVYLEITEKGQETLEALRIKGRKAMKNVFNNLSETELQSLVEIFEQAAGNLNKIKEEHDE